MTTLQVPRAKRAEARPRLRVRWSLLALVGAVAVVLWGYVVSPLLATFRTSAESAAAGEGLYAAFLGPTTARESMLTSFGIALASVVVCAVVGVGVALLLNRFEFPGRRALETLTLVPIALPPLIGVVAFVFLYARSGIVPRGLQELFGTAEVPFFLDGITGVLVVHAFTMYPYFYLPVAGALAGLDPSLEEAAYNLGAGRWHWWTRVLFPMLTPALVSGALLVFMVAMASYTAPLLFGVNRTMTMQIYLARTNGDLGLASTHATVLAVVSVVFLISLRWYQDRRSYRSVSKGTGAARREVRGPGRWVALAGCVAAAILLLAPIATLVLISLSVNGSWTVQVLPPEYTLDNFRELATESRALRPIVNSLRASTIATAAGLALAVAAAFAVTQTRFRGRGLLDVAMMLPWALPGTVVGINLIAAFNQPNAFGFGQVLVGTFWILPLAYFVRFSPLMFRSTAASFSQLDPSLDEAARNLGAGWWHAFRRVTLPLVARGVVAGALLAFVQGVGEFVASVLVYTARTEPISVEISNRLYSFDYGTAAAYGLLQVLLIFVVLVVSRRQGRSEQALPTVG